MKTMYRKLPQGFQWIFCIRIVLPKTKCRMFIFFRWVFFAEISIMRLISGHGSIRTGRVAGTHSAVPEKRATKAIAHRIQ